MIRYMISPIIGTGTIQDAYRVAVADVANTNASASIPTHTSGPDIGEPIYNFAMCVVATANLPLVSAVSNSLTFPDYPLDARMDGMEQNARTAMVQSVEAYDVDGNGLHLDASHDDDESYRDVLNAIGQQLDPAFNVANLTVPEVVL